MAMTFVLLVYISILFVIAHAEANVTHLPLCKGPRKIKLEVRDFKSVLSWKNSSTFGQAFENFDVQTCLSECRNVPSNFRWAHRDCTYTKTHNRRYYCKLNLRHDFNGQLRICPFQNESSTGNLCTVYNNSCGKYGEINIVTLSKFSKPRFTLINNSSTSVELNVKERSGKFLCNFDEIEYTVYIKKITNEQRTHFCVDNPPTNVDEATKHSYHIHKDDIMNPCDSSNNPSLLSFKFDGLDPASSYCVFGKYDTKKLYTQMGPSAIGYIKVSTEAETTAAATATETSATAATPPLYIILPSVFSSIIFIALLGIAIKYGLVFRKSIIEKSPLVEEMFKIGDEDMHQLLHLIDNSRIDEFIEGETPTHYISEASDIVVSNDINVPKYIAKNSESKSRNEDHGSTSSSGFSSSEVFQLQSFPFQNDEQFVSSHDYSGKSGIGILRQLDGNDSQLKSFSSPNEKRFVNLQSSCSNLNQQRNNECGDALVDQSLRSTASSSEIIVVTNSYWDKEGNIIDEENKELQSSNKNFNPSDFLHGSSSYWDKNGEVMLEQSEEICNSQTEAVTSKTSFKENTKNSQTSGPDYISKLKSPDCKDFSTLLDNAIDDAIYIETNEEDKILINDNEKNSAMRCNKDESIEMMGHCNIKANRFSSCSSGIQEDIAKMENEIAPRNNLCTSHLGKIFEKNPCLTDYDLSSLGTSVNQYQTVSDFGDRFQTQPLLQGK